MSCAKIGIVVFALVIALFTLWPSISSPAVSQAVIIASVVIIALLAWTGTDCRWCARPAAKSSKPKRR